MVDLFLHAWSFRFRLLHDPSFGIEELAERAVADGNPGIGLNVNGPHGRFLDIADPASVRAVGDALRERGLACDLETSSTDRDHLARHLDAAAALGARHVHTCTRVDRPHAELIDATVADLRAIAPIAEDRGVPVLLENHEEFTGAEVARILEAVDHPYVGALYDYGNSMPLHEDPLEALDAMLPWTRAAHMKDHVVMGGRVCGVTLGEGRLPVVEITRRLAAAGMTRIAFENVWGYSAPFAPRPDGGPEETAANPLFAEVADPGDPGFALLAAEAEFARDPGRVVALEEESYRRAYPLVVGALRDAGLLAPR